MLGGIVEILLRALQVTERHRSEYTEAIGVVGFGLKRYEGSQRGSLEPLRSSESVWVKKKKALELCFLILEARGHHGDAPYSPLSHPGTLRYTSTNEVSVYHRNVQTTECVPEGVTVAHHGLTVDSRQ
ncbi:hypothetical protein JRQ81_019042 [Phrynocephalus forsythii]|uniref:Uncharacterized protein n=1 Tax=Phrynocephalus forsythii TaxID=171643 RepID=A0A9Q0XLA9_9SAUR|nr:hypothetical protein JRQ81_019042 [Phrynocephalus forsythii]